MDSFDWIHSIEMLQQHPVEKDIATPDFFPSADGLMRSQEILHSSGECDPFDEAIGAEKSAEYKRLYRISAQKICPTTSSETVKVLMR